MIKQTQTKMFDFSDVGLDFCAGSKNKFPEVFKKILSAGYNPKIANSVSISGSQIILTYGVNHDYVADRALLVTATGGFNKEVYIDSVTSNTVTCTVLDNVTTGLTGTINTKIASIGWDIVYEVSNIQIYKMKHIDGTDRFVRFCFQNNPNHRNAVAVCIGKTANLTTGVIDDPQALQSTAGITSPSAINLPRWDGYEASASANSYSYQQGYSQYGKGVIVGSLYHFAFLAGDGYQNAPHHIYGIFPAVCYEYGKLDYPVLIGNLSSSTENYGPVYGNFSSGVGGSAFIGNIRVRFDAINTIQNSAMNNQSVMQATSSFLPDELDNFNTTTALQLPIYENSTSQHLGYIYGLYLCMYSVENIPNVSIYSLPAITTDIDYSNKVVITASATNNNSPYGVRFFAIPVEAIKHGY